MGFRCGNGPASFQLSSKPGLAVKKSSQYVSSYHASFNVASSSQVGFLKLSGQGARAPKKSNSEGALTNPLKSGPRIAIARTAWADDEDISHSKKIVALEPNRQTVIDCRRDSGSDSRVMHNASSDTILEHTPRKLKRAAAEFLTNPDVEELTRSVFQRFCSAHNLRGAVPAKEVGRLVRVLSREFSLPSHCKELSELLLHRFDVDGDNQFKFKEFFDLFLSMLRRVVFDRTTITGREFFIAENTDPVWRIWNRIKQLGEGSFGAAYLCEHKRSKEVRVIKAIKKANAKIPVEDIEREIIVMRQIDHPHVVRLFMWHEDPSYIYLVMEALEGGTLNDALFSNGRKGQPVKERWIREVTSQVLEAMSFCHKLRVVHKDLKDENIMLLKQDSTVDRPYAVVIDLGMAEMFSPADPRGQVCGGTPTTMAPEVWLDDFGPKCDVWSVGVVLFEMLAGRYPFMAKTLKPQAWINLHKRGADWSLIRTSPLGKSLCQTMLKFSEADRPSMNDCLQHAWFDSSAEVTGKVTPQQFSQLKSFCDDTKLKRTLLLELASRLPMHMAGEVLDIFKRFDSDKDGSLSKWELHNTFNEMGIHDEVLISRIFRTLDVDMDGLLSLSEFSAAVLVLFRDLLDDRLHALFRRKDKDGNGYLDAEEAKVFLENCTAMLTKEANQRSFDLLDELYKGGETKIRYEDLREKLLGF